MDGVGPRSENRPFADDLQPGPGVFEPGDAGVVRAVEDAADPGFDRGRAGQIEKPGQNGDQDERLRFPQGQDDDEGRGDADPGVAGVGQHQGDCGRSEDGRPGPPPPAPAEEGQSHGQGQEEAEQAGLGHVMSHEAADPHGLRGAPGLEIEISEGVERGDKSRTEDGPDGKAQAAQTRESRRDDGHDEKDQQFARGRQAYGRVRGGRRGQERPADIDKERPEKMRDFETPLFFGQQLEPEKSGDGPKGLQRADGDEREQGRGRRGQKKSPAGQGLPGCGRRLGDHAHGLGFRTIISSRGVFRRPRPSRRG